MHKIEKKTRFAQAIDDFINVALICTHIYYSHTASGAAVDAVAALLPV